MHRVRALLPAKAWFLLLLGFAILAASGVYLGTITAMESLFQQSFQDYTYQLVFLGHIFIGILLCLPLLWFAIKHVRVAWKRPNKKARTLGIGLLSLSIALLLSGLLISRFEDFIAITPNLRDQLYWLHIACAAALLPLFLWHRLSGSRRINWKSGKRVAVATGLFALALLALGLSFDDESQKTQSAQLHGDNDFALSLAKTASGGLIEPSKLMVDDYCKDCHADTHRTWLASAHRFSSFNNPAYAFSVRELRQQLIAEDKPLSGVMFCAACHDPVPLFAGYLRDPKYDDINHPTATAGINCLACHAITSVDSTRGNGDYTIDEPQHYPFAFSQNETLAALSKQLIRAKPALHKRSFLKPFHRTAEFCSSCHKVFLPEALNNYKWLRGQNHYDSFLLSGVSGHSVASFYYPQKARENCQQCHMQPDHAETDLAANLNPEGNQLVIPDHAFAAANTGIWPLMGLPDPAAVKREASLKGALRVDIFGLRDGGNIDSPLLAPLRPELPTLIPGRKYLIETVLRTLTLGHPFTQGTADSNEVWLEFQVRHQGHILFSSGELNDAGEVDPWSHFVNIYMLDKEGKRIDRRNVRDIFVPLYNNQIPPGAADVVHYLLPVPAQLTGELEIEAKLWYRKFDAAFIRHIRNNDGRANDLPKTLIASDRVVFTLASIASHGLSSASSSVPEWERWNDYGIALLRKQGPGGRGQLRQAGEAFAWLEQKLGRSEGALNSARVHIAEGNLDLAAAALHRASEHAAPAYPWSIAWFSGQISQQRGQFDDALKNFMALANTDFAEARRRGFDFSRDYNLINEIGQSLFEQARQQRSRIDQASFNSQLGESAQWFEKTIALDAENAMAHFNLAQIYMLLGQQERATTHQQMHQMVKPDENAVERAVTRHRAENPAADHAAESVVIYSLHPNQSHKPLAQNSGSAGKVVEQP